nr:hypothetical protein [uncultured Porphyromonas sp.]
MQGYHRYATLRTLLSDMSGGKYPSRYTIALGTTSHLGDNNLTKTPSKVI